MVTFNLKKKQFKNNDKWPLLFVVAEIYSEESNSKRALTYLEVAQIAKAKYGLHIERRTVSQYVTYLEDYFDFKFIKSGHGKYLKRQYESPENTCSEETSNYSNIETIKSDAYKQLEHNIDICKKGIKKNILLKYRCPKYITQKMNVVSKTIVLVPIKVFRFNMDYFLLAYYPPISDYYFVNLSKTVLKSSSLVFESSLNIKRNMPQFDLNGYLLKNNTIASGRSTWKTILKLYRSEREAYEEDDGLFTFETNYLNRKIPLPEILTTLEEIFGEENVLGPDVRNDSNGTWFFHFGIDSDVYKKITID